MTGTEATAVRLSESGCGTETHRLAEVVITGLVPVIHVFGAAGKAWMTGVMLRMQTNMPAQPAGRP